eukprot:5721758-Prymnesium_polylepis.1
MWAGGLFWGFWGLWDACIQRNVKTTLRDPPSLAARLCSIGAPTSSYIGRFGGCRSNFWAEDRRRPRGEGIGKR